MGLDINGAYSDKSFHAGYSGLHAIRSLAIFVSLNKRSKLLNTEVTWKEANELEREGSWDKFPEFWQLLHFADNEGYLLPAIYLKDVDYKNAFYIGSLDKLYDELSVIKEEITSNMKPYEPYTRARELFWSLFNLTEDEFNEGGHLIFS